MSAASADCSARRRGGADRIRELSRQVRHRIQRILDADGGDRRIGGNQLAQDLAFLQLASITGLAGPTFLISLVGATLELTLDRMSVGAPSSSEGGPRSLAAAARPLPGRYQGETR